MPRVAPAVPRAAPTVRQAARTAPRSGWFLGIDGGRDGDDVDVVRRGSPAALGGEGERAAAQVGRIDLARAVMAAPQFGDPAGVDVEAGTSEMPGERDGERKSDIAQADHRDFRCLHR